MRHLVIVILLATIFAGCSRHKIIEDNDLQQILQEVFLVNAYYSMHPINCDSLDMYKPILDKYGYSVEDMSYTLSNFSKRKSSRLSDVIDQAIRGLEKEYKVYEDAVSVLDTIDMIAAERYKTVIHKDSLLTIKSLRDTSKLIMKFPARPGKYSITYNYQFDSTDTNYGLRGSFQIVDNKKNTLATNTAWLRTYSREKVDITLESADSAKKLLVNLVNYSKTATDPSVRIDSLRIVHYIPKKAALDSVNKHLIEYKLPFDTTYSRKLDIPLKQ